MEGSNNIPKLTLDSFPEAEMDSLSLDSSVAEQVAPVGHDLKKGLTNEEKKVVDEFANKIDITNSTQMLQYGASAQKRMLGFSESALSNVRAKDMEGIGEMISGLATQLRSFSPEETERGIFGFFKRGGNKIIAMKAKYDTVEKNVDKIVDTLEGHKMVLLKDIAMLDKMFEMNLVYYKELTMYILAGRQKLEAVLATDLPVLQEKARETGKPEDAQAANDLAERCNRFDKKLHDLELTRNICLQMGPQIRLIQANDSVMVEKIQSSIANTIPLWKNQMVLALGLVHSAEAIDAQRQVANITNELLRKNADTLKTSTVAAAKETERGIVDIETLKYTNESLIATLDEVLQIQQEGRRKRKDAEGELQRIENDLKSKLLEIRDATKSV